MFSRNVFRRIVGLLPAQSRTASDAVFRSMVEQSVDVICYLVDGRFTYVSPSAGTTFGWKAGAMVGADGLDLIYRPDMPILKEVLARRTSGEEIGPVRHQLRVVCGDGSLKWSETCAHSKPGAGGKTQTVLVIRDISDRKRAEEELKTLAMQDGLTGLANRRSFDDMLERSWGQTLRSGGEMALLLMDIDHFKQLNDSYGHQVGDDCLRVVATTLSGFVRRPADLACRYGGDEFAVILGDAGAKAAIKIAEEIRSTIVALAVPRQARPGSEFLTVSIGVATAMARIGGSVRMPESLLQAADHALYKAKAAGRNNVECSVLIASSE